MTQTVRVNSSLHPKCMNVFKYKPVMFRKQIMLKRKHVRIKAHISQIDGVKLVC